MERMFLNHKMMNLKRHKLVQQNIDLVDEFMLLKKCQYKKIYIRKPKDYSKLVANVRGIYRHVMLKVENYLMHMLV